MQDLIVFAENREEMVASQLQMVEWATYQLEQAKTDLIDASANLAHAIQNKLKQAGWKAQEKKAMAKVEYYEKIQAAIREGYVVVPNFPVDIFAVRTSRSYPVGHYQASWESTPDDVDRTQQSQILPLGAGETYSDEPRVSTLFGWKDRATGKNVWTHRATKFQDVDLPMKMVKPIILDRTSKALKLKVFDEIGILPARPSKMNRLALTASQVAMPRGVDPMVIGRIKFKNGRNEKIISFLIAWWLKASDLAV